MKNKFWLVLLFCLFSAKNVFAIALYPNAIDIFSDSKKRTEVLRVINQSDKPITYRASIVQIKQDENGKISLSGKNVNSAHDHIVFTPRQFVVMPGKPQYIRIATKNLAKLKDGEYVSHLKIAEVPVKANVKSQKKDESKTEITVQKEGVSISLKMYFSMVVPVTIYKGKNLTQETEVLSAKQTGDKLDLVLQRKGEISSRLSIKVYDEKGNEIGKSGVRIYAPNGKRNLSITLKDKNVKAKKIELIDALSKQKIMEKAI